jgi:hypothetical protein
VADRQYRIIELPGAGRLGRHVQHDPLSANFRIAAPTEWHSVQHKRRVPSYDQGDLGDCTIQALSGILSTAPFPHHYRSQATMRKLYVWETAHDEFDGQYPPDDTGSSGLAAMKTGRDKLHAIRTFSHGFGYAEGLGLLLDRSERKGTAVGLGTVWLDSMDQPSMTGGTITAYDVRIGHVRGGHEYECSGLRLQEEGRLQGTDLIELWQSWRVGLPPFYMTVEALDLLLQQDGDVVAPDWEM